MRANVQHLGIWVKSPTSGAIELIASPSNNPHRTNDLAIRVSKDGRNIWIDLDPKDITELINTLARYAG